MTTATPRTRTAPPTQVAGAPSRAKAVRPPPRAGDVLSAVLVALGCAGALVHDALRTHQEWNSAHVTVQLLDDAGTPGPTLDAHGESARCWSQLWSDSRDRDVHIPVMQGRTRSALSLSSYDDVVLQTTEVGRPRRQPTCEPHTLRFTVRPPH